MPNAKNGKGSILEPNAFTLFLILILLIMGSGYDLEGRLAHLSRMLRASSNAVKMMRAGMNEFRSSMVPPNSNEFNNNTVQ